MNALVLDEAGSLDEAPGAFRAVEGFLSGMDPLMSNERRSLGETSPAHRTRERLLPRVLSLM